MMVRRDRVRIHRETRLLPGYVGRIDTAFYVYRLMRREVLSVRVSVFSGKLGRNTDKCTCTPLHGP
jgi:hypothetical protein